MDAVTEPIMAEASQMDAIANCRRNQTWISHELAALRDMRDSMSERNPSVARHLALAYTHLEDAGHRFAKAQELLEKQ